MFFSNNLFTVGNKKDGAAMAVIWMAATVGSTSARSLGSSSSSGLKKLSRKEVSSVDVVKACNYLVDPPEPMALRLSSNLMMGAARVLGNQYSFLYSDANQVFARLKRVFSDLSAGAEINMAVVEAYQKTITVTDNDKDFIAPEEPFRFLNEMDQNFGWIVTASSHQENSSFPSTHVGNKAPGIVDTPINVAPSPTNDAFLHLHTLSDRSSFPFAGSGSSYGTPGYYCDTCLFIGIPSSYHALKDFGIYSSRIMETEIMHLMTLFSI
ncbi:Rec8 like protein-domain-containing protein [Zopfochytrium polystomum]|nr:Rec8 like protein-domain-containing protein [Zopfochytrium polystomum]